MIERFGTILKDCLLRGYGNPRRMKWTHKEFAAKIGYNSDMIGRYVNHHSLPNSTNINVICATLLPDEQSASAEQRDRVEDLRTAWINEDYMRTLGKDIQPEPLLPQPSSKGKSLFDYLKSLNATEAMVNAALKILSERDVPIENRAERIIEAILLQMETIRSLRSAVQGVDPELDRLRAAAVDAIEAGQLEEADSYLAELEEKEENLKLKEQILAAAGTKAERGRIALSQLRYLDAAKYFDDAADQVPRSSQETYLDYLGQAAWAYFRQGEEFGEREWAEEAVLRFRRLLDLRPREQAPLEWALVQSNIGISLRILGERDPDTKSLNEAVDAFRSALEEWTREDFPHAWAMSQNNLGNALYSLGQRETDTNRLNEAVDAYRNALAVWKSKDAPRWSDTQNNLGNALLSLGEREAGTERLEQAVNAFQEALNGWRREHAPLDWAMSQHNLGLALCAIGERERETKADILEQAVEAFNNALEEWTRERVPLRWATAQDNLGTTLLALGKNEADMKRLEEAVGAYKNALNERTWDRVPLDWAKTQNNLGEALQAMAEREESTDRLKKAISSYRAALTVFKNGNATYYVTYVERNLAEAEALLKKLRIGSFLSRSAVTQEFHSTSRKL